jgi:hypothetical protein
MSFIAAFKVCVPPLVSLILFPIYGGGTMVVGVQGPAARRNHCRSCHPCCFQGESSARVARTVPRVSTMF